MLLSSKKRVNILSSVRGERIPRFTLGYRVFARDAFTLVEVVLALGICLVAVLPVVGLLPVAFQLAQEATETTQGAKIIQRVANDFLQMPFDQLTALFGGDPSNTSIVKNFSYDGMAVPGTDGAYYKVTATRHPCLIPGASGRATNIYPVVIGITTPKGGNPKTMTITIVNTGY